MSPIDKPVGMDSIEQYKTAAWSCEGRCLVWPTQMTMAETNETRKLPRLPEEFITLSPDLRTAVTNGLDEPEQNRISIKLVDLETFKVEDRALNRSDNLWLLDYTNGIEGIATHFKWEHAADAKDKLVYPAAQTNKNAGRPDARTSRE